MRFNSNAGNLALKLLCVIAALLLALFLIFHKKEDTLRDEVYNIEKNVSSVDSSDAIQSTTADQDVNINSFPFSISKPIPAEGTEEDDNLHFYNVEVPLQAGSIVDIALKEPEGADLALGIFDEDDVLAYTNNTKNGGNEDISFVLINSNPITIAVETIASPRTGSPGQYALLITSNSEEKGYLIESFPYIATKHIQENEKIHLYQTMFPVDKGMIVGAVLKAADDANLVFYLADEKEALGTSKSKGEGEQEATLTFFDGGMVSIVVERNPVENQTSNGGEIAGNSDDSYSLSVNTKGMEHLIESLPYTNSGYLSQADVEEKNWHWYQIPPHVPVGSVISANLSVKGKANMDVTIFVDRDTISYGASRGIGENEHAELTIEKDSKVYIIIDNVEGEGIYSLNVTSSVALTKP